MKEGDYLYVGNKNETKDLDTLIKEAYVRYDFLSELRFQQAKELAKLLNKDENLQKEKSRMAVADPEIKGLVFIPCYS
ncbi:MAG TPA: hypothetical protein PLJ37_00715 [Chitinophagales bacterium]|nr:hypothetical protein [Chitinophagales bacterium]HMW93473.1 hypothetical protein [Chitinophagales bacterium]HMZ92904.1 hypothetical protein [Chitinophagales bacterium]HNG25907.1 hypothetical protein [Chitinophagales bacterium]